MYTFVLLARTVLQHIHIFIKWDELPTFKHQYVLNHKFTLQMGHAYYTANMAKLILVINLSNQYFICTLKNN